MVARILLFDWYGIPSRSYGVAMQLLWYSRWMLDGWFVVAWVLLGGYSILCGCYGVVRLLLRYLRRSPKSFLGCGYVVVLVLKVVPIPSLVGVWHLIGVCHGS